MLFKLFLLEVSCHVLLHLGFMVPLSLPIERVEFEGIDETECYEEDNVIVYLRSVGGLDYLSGPVASLIVITL